MSDNNDGQGKYECPEDHEVFDNAFEFGRHCRNSHRGSKIKPIINGIEEAPRVEVTRNPQNDYDNLERIMLNAGMAKGVAANVRIIYENYPPEDIDSLEALLRENGINKAVRNLVVATYAAKLGIEIQEPEKKVPAEDNADNYTEKLVKQRLRRHELYVQARTSGMSDEDMELLFPEFAGKRTQEAEKETKKTYIFPPTANGQPMQLTDSEYAHLYNQWLAIQKQNQQMPSDIELYREIGQSLKEAGLMANVRPVKDEVQLQMMTSSLKTIESRLNKTEPISSLITSVINKLNDSGKLPSLIDRALSRFEQPRPEGVPVKRYSEDDFEKINAKLEQNSDIFQQKMGGQQQGEKPLDNAVRQAQIDHLTGKPMPMEITFEAEKKRLKEEFGMTDDEVSQLIGNVKSQKEMNQILGKLEKIKNGN